jgi:UDP-2,3-diacylglucosamine pyrophosphatase LpxH
LFTEKILKAAREGSTVYYTYGNHDDLFNCFSSTCFIKLSNINIQKEFVYETCGHKILITHGDKHDHLNKCTKYLRRSAYTSNSWIIKKLISLLNEVAHEIEKKLVKWENKKRRFKRGLQEQSKLKDCKAVICGHIHTPDIHRATDSDNPKFLYMNCGDYLSKETCIVEDYEGNFSLLDKGEVVKSVQM